MTPEQLIAKLNQCRAQGHSGLNLQTAECCDGLDCVTGYTTGGGGGGGGGGGTGTTLPTELAGKVIVDQAEWTQTRAERDNYAKQRWYIGLGAGVGGLGLGALLGYALSK